MCDATRRYSPRRPRHPPGRDSSGGGTVSRAGRRYLRTLVIGTAALAVLVWMGVDQFGVPREEILELFVTTLLVVGAVIVLAPSAVLLWMCLRKLCQRRQR